MHTHTHTRAQKESIDEQLLSVVQSVENTMHAIICPPIAEKANLKCSKQLAANQNPWPCSCALKPSNAVKRSLAM